MVYMKEPLAFSAMKVQYEHTVYSSTHGLIQAHIIGRLIFNKLYTCKFCLQINGSCMQSLYTAL
jgi:hypothetical protein